MAAQAVIDIGGLSLTFTTADGPVYALENIDLKVDDGDFVSFIGSKTLRFRLNTEALGKERPGGFEKVGKYEHVVMGGTLHVVRPGLTELQVKDLSVEGLRVPHAAVPALLSQLASYRPEGVASDGIAVATPKYIGDVRVANGRITVYRTTGTRH